MENTDSEYRWRNLPCYDHNDNERTWCVSGRVRCENGLDWGGVLEWCDSELDAARVMAMMHKDYRFFNLAIEEKKASEAYEVQED